jgi:hypothetical protein
MILAASVLIFADCAICAAQDGLQDDKAVMAGIRSMLADPFTEKSRSAEKTVVDFSQASDKVNVIVSRSLGYYPGSDWTDMLLAHYIAGVVKVQLEDPSKTGDSRTAIRSGLQAALSLYKKIKAKDPSLRIGELEGIDARIKNGDMELVIDEALARVKAERPG